MFKTLTRTTAALCLTSFALWGCSEQSGTSTSNAADDPANRQAVLTTFAPTTYFAERIAGGLVDVENPIPHDEDPIFFKPDAETIARYQDAALIIVNGADFEKWVPTAPLPRSRVINTAASFEDEFITYQGTTHSHGSAGEHSHEGIDGHTWLDPMNAIQQATAIKDGLSRTFPDHAAAFDENLTTLNDDLLDLDARLNDLTPTLASVELLASHPAYNYLAARYDWGITNLDLDPEDTQGSINAAGEVFTPAGDRLRVMLWESEPTPEIRAEFESRFGITSVVFSPAETRAPGDPDYLEIQRANIQRLADALR